MPTRLQGFVTATEDSGDDEEQRKRRRSVPPRGSSQEAAASQGGGASGSAEPQPAAGGAEAAGSRAEKLRAAAGPKRKANDRTDGKGKQEIAPALNSFSGGQRTLVELMLKATLASAQANRTLAGALLETWLGPSESHLAREAKQDMKLYGEATRGQRGHTLGPPHVHCYGGMLRGIQREAEEKLNKEKESMAVPELRRFQEELEKLKDQLNLYEHLSVAEAAVVVLHCKVSDCYRSEQCRLQVVWSSMDSKGREWSDTVKYFLAGGGWERQAGAAPPSNIERQLQQAMGTGRAAGARPRKE